MQQIIVVLLGDPPHIRHGECLAAVPCGGGHLILQRHEGQLRPHTQIAGEVGQHTVLQMLTARLPAHIGAGSVSPCGGGHLADADHQDMGQCIHQPVAVLIDGAIRHRAGAHVLRQRAQTHLRRGDQAGGLHEHHIIHLVEKLGVGLVHRQVMDAGAGDDAHIQRTGLLLQHTHTPQARQARDGLQALLTPGDDILLHAVPAQHDQHLPMAQQRVVHGIKGVGDQVIVKGVVEEDAAALQQIPAGDETALIHREAPVQQRAHIAAVQLHRLAHLLLHLRQQLIAGHIAVAQGSGGDIIRHQTVAKQAAQGLPQHRIVALAAGVVLLALQLVLLILLLQQAVQKVVNLAHEDHTEHREEGLIQQLPAHQRR